MLESTASVADIATRIGTAAIGGDRATALASMLTYEQLVELSGHAGEGIKEEWHREIEDFFASARNENGHAIVVDSSIIGTGKFTPEKDGVARKIDVAFVKLVVEVDCPGCSTPRIRETKRIFARMLFVNTPWGWKFAIQQ
jgi:hypothetical protein